MGRSATPSPSGSDLSQTPSSDSETPVSVALTAELQLEGARQERQQQESCIVA